MKLHSIIRPSDLSSSELAERVTRAPGGTISELFIVRDDDREVAFVIIDWWRKESHAVLYELYVPSALRGKGIGTGVLKAVERLVRRRGRSSLRLIPRPIDASGSVEALEKWYRDRGYEPIPSDANGAFGKILSDEDGRLSPVNLWLLSEEFLAAAKREFDQDQVGVCLPAYFLAGRSLELALKSYILAQGGDETLLRSISHNLVRALREARDRGLDRFVSHSEEDAALVRWTNAYYERKDLEYPTTGSKSYPAPNLLVNYVAKMRDGIGVPIRRWRPARTPVSQ